MTGYQLAPGHNHPTHPTSVATLTSPINTLAHLPVRIENSTQYFEYIKNLLKDRNNFYSAREFLKQHNLAVCTKEKYFCISQALQCGWSPN
jgi:hypothetical protein